MFRVLRIIGFRVQGLGFRIQGVRGLGCRVYGSVSQTEGPTNSTILVIGTPRDGKA